MLKKIKKLFLQKKIRNKSNCCFVYLVHGSDTLKIFENSVYSLRMVNPVVEIYVFCNEELFNDIIIISKKYNFSVKTFKINIYNKYQKFRSENWVKITKKKFDIINYLLNKNFYIVIYVDIDVVFISNPENYIKKINKNFIIGAQSESLPVYPAEFCTGFMFFNKKSQYLIKKLINYKSSGDDQFTFNKFISKKKLHNIVFCFPESLFQNGLHYKNFIGKRFFLLKSELKPFIFHANYVLGAKNKIKLLKHINLWKKRI